MADPDYAVSTPRESLSSQWDVPYKTYVVTDVSP
jgi:hypothetical protein